MPSPVQVTRDALEAHYKKHVGGLLTPGWASDMFDHLYAAWIQARWDEGDEWVRKVWSARPEVPDAPAP